MTPGLHSRALFETIELRASLDITFDPAAVDQAGKESTPLGELLFH